MGERLSPMSEYARRLIAVVGMVREARIIAGPGVTVVIGGGDAASLERKLIAAIDAHPTEPPPRLLSFGVCGALSPDLNPGDLVIGRDVISETSRWMAVPEWRERLSRANPKARVADVAAGDVMVGSIDAKRALFARTGAAVVDMESHVVGRIAEDRDLTFAVVRAVSDAADHALPPAALAGLRADGRPDIGAVLRSLAARPSQFPALLRTARGAEAAFKTLAGLNLRRSEASPH
jgi:hopanoid-associated phosphorylase